MATYTIHVGHIAGAYMKMGTLSTTAKIITGILVSVVVLAVALGVGLGLFYQHNQGPIKFAAVQVVDMDSHTSAPRIQPGDQVRLRYTSASTTSRLVNWLFAADGKTFETVVKNYNGTAYSYTIPTTVTTAEGVFRVQDAQATGDFLDSHPVTIGNPFAVIKGVGLKARTVLYVDNPTTLVVDVDLANSPDLSQPTDWTILFSTTPNFQHSVNGMVTAVNNTSVTFTVTNQVSTGSYYQLRSSQEPKTYMFQSPFPVQVSYIPECPDVPPTNEFSICSIVMVGAAGQGQFFQSHESVALKVSFGGVYTDQIIAFSYTTDGNSFTPFLIVSDPDTTSHVYTVTTTLPTVDTVNFQVQGVVNNTSVLSSKYDVGPAINFIAPQNMLVYPADIPDQTAYAVKTYVNYDPSLSGFTTSVQVATKNLSGILGTFVDVVAFTDMPTESKAQVTWMFTQNDIDFGPNDALLLTLVMRFTGPLGSIEGEGGNTLFQKNDFAPDRAPIVDNDLNMSVTVYPGGMFSRTNEIGYDRGQTDPERYLQWFYAHSADYGNLLCAFQGANVAPLGSPCFADEDLQTANFVPDLQRWDSNPANVRVIPNDIDIPSSFYFEGEGEVCVARVLLPFPTDWDLTVAHGDQDVCGKTGEYVLLTAQFNVPIQ